MIVEDDVRVCVLARHRVSPQLLHEEDLIGELRSRTVSRGSSFFDPVGQVSNKIEEKITLRHRYDFVGDLDEEAESFRRPQVQPLRDVLAKVLGSRRGINLESLYDEKR